MLNSSFSQPAEESLQQFQYLENQCAEELLQNAGDNRSYLSKVLRMDGDDLGLLSFNFDVRSF